MDPISSQSAIRKLFEKKKIKYLLENNLGKNSKAFDVRTWNDFALKFDAGISTHLPFEIWTIHLFALSTVSDANAEEIKSRGGIYCEKINVI